MSGIEGKHRRYLKGEVEGSVHSQVGALLRVNSKMGRANTILPYFLLFFETPKFPSLTWHELSSI